MDINPGIAFLGWLLQKEIGVKYSPCKKGCIYAMGNTSLMFLWKISSEKVEGWNYTAGITDVSYMGYNSIISGIT